MVDIKGTWGRDDGSRSFEGQLLFLAFQIDCYIPVDYASFLLSRKGSKPVETLWAYRTDIIMYHYYGYGLIEGIHTWCIDDRVGDGLMAIGPSDTRRGMDPVWS
jgi:hypothetical protein